MTNTNGIRPSSPSTHQRRANRTRLPRIIIQRRLSLCLINLVGVSMRPNASFEFFVRILVRWCACGAIGVLGMFACQCHQVFGFLAGYEHVTLVQSIGTGISESVAGIERRRIGVCVSYNKFGPAGCSAEEGGTDLSGFPFVVVEGGFALGLFDLVLVGVGPDAGFEFLY